MTLGIAVIGSGIFIKEEHLPAIQASSSSIVLKAIYSRTRASAAALTNSTDVDLYSDDSGAGKTYHDLLLRDDIHGVIIALPIPAQPQYIEAALAAGKHVLSEKPIAADLKHAQHLLAYYKSAHVKGGATWAVAENFRFLESFQYGRKEVKKLGRVLGFRVRSGGNVKAGDKYFETSWRKKPQYQGGFLLDGGIHYCAATRMLLGEAAQPTAVSAFTTLLQPHLAPVDTLNSIWLTESGVSGTFTASFGTTFSGREYTVACEKGVVTVERGKVTVHQGQQSEGHATVKEFPDEGSGVKQEVAAWAQSIVGGKPNAQQSPEQALADLELVEMLLRSGEGQGKTEMLQYQM